MRLLYRQLVLNVAVHWRGWRLVRTRRAVARHEAALRSIRDEARAHLNGRPTGGDQ